MRKHLFKWMLLLVAFMVPLATNAQEDVFIGDEEVTTTSSNLPGYNYYDYSISQQIYTADEIGVAGSISSVSVKNTGAEKTRTYAVYMALTDKDAFESTSDWVNMTSDNLVFSGAVTFVAGEWTAIMLDNVFEYDGASNLLITMVDNTGDYSNSPHMSCLTFPGTNQALYKYQDNNAIDPTNITVTGTRMSVKNQIHLEIIPSGAQVCGRPTGLSIIPMSDAASFSWSPVEGVDSYQWLYTLVGDEPNWDEAEQIDATEIEFGGLDPNTSYVAYVRSLCDFGNSNPRAITFKTACSAYEVTDEEPYVYGFETEDELSCWTLGNGATVYENSTWSTYSYSGSKCLRLYGSSVLTVLPDFAEVNALQLDFYAKLYSTSYASTLEVGYMTDPTDASTFEPVKSFASSEYSTTYELLHVGFATVPEGARIAIRHTSTSNYAGWYLDDFTVSRMPSCVAPDVVTISDITTTSAVVSWTPGLPDDNTWEVEFRELTEDEEADWTSLGTISENPFEIGELTPNTPYQVRVRTFCSDAEQSDWAAVANFRTSCEPYVVDGDNPFVENFNDADFAFICWTNEHVDGPGNKLWEHNTSVSASTVHEGAGSLKLPDMSATTHTLLALPAMNLDESAEGYEVSFWMYRNSGSKPNEGVKLWVNHQPDTVDGVELMHVTRAYNQGPEETQEEATGWYKYTAEIPAEYIGGTTYVIFMGISEYGNFSNLDDITVQAVSSCDVPTISGVTATTSNSATLTWTSPEGTTNWQLRNGEELINVAIDNVEQGEETISYTLNDLEANTDYSVQLRSVCNGVNSAWAEGNFSFTTLNNETSIVAVNFVDQVGVTIDAENHMVNVTMLYGSDLSSVSGQFTLSNGASVYYGDMQIPTTFADLNLSEPRTLLVVAEDSAISEEWTIVLSHETCATATNLAALPERVKATITWNIGDETVEYFNYLLTYEGDTAVEFENNPMVQTINVVGEGNTRTFELTNLSRATAYRLYLKNACSDWSVAQQVTFTTHDLNECIEFVAGTGTMTQAPLYTNYGGEYSIQIYTAEQLLEQGYMAGEITGISYYLASAGSDVATKTNKIGSVWMMNTDKASFSNSNDWITSGMTQVKEADTVVFSPAASWIEIPFDQGFMWDGTSNLAVATLFVSTSSYMTSAFRGGQVAENQVIYAYSDNTGLTLTEGIPTLPSGNPSMSVTKNLPNIQLCFAFEACPAVAEAAVENIGAESATLTWTAAEGDYLETYSVILSETVIEDFDSISANITTVIGAATSLELTGLNPFTNYFVYIRANCANGEGSSTWFPVSFRTQSPCHPADNLEAVLTDRNSVHVTWTNDMESDFEYVLLESDMDEMDSVNPIFMTASDELDLTDLNYETDYTLYVRHNCGNNGVSPWLSVEFSTLPSCPMVESVEVEADANIATFTITNAEFSPATAWRITVMNNFTNEEVFNQVVTTNPYVVFGLTAETEYIFDVAAVCDVEESEPYSNEFTTLVAPGDCQTVAEGTGTNYYVPVYGNYCDAVQHTQSIYPAEMLSDLQGQTITSLHYYVESGSSANWSSLTFNVKMMVTEETSLSSAFVDATDAEPVYTGTLSASVTDGMTITLDQPFTYEGGNLLIDFYLPVSGGYTSCTFKGVSSTGSSREGHGSSGVNNGSVQNFLPMVDFCVEPSACRAVRDLTVSDITGEGAEISWLPGGAETAWQVFVTTEDLTANDLVVENYETVNAINYTVTGFAADADCYVFVRAICDAEEELYSDWKMVFFTTTATCSAPEAAEANVEMNGNVTFTVVAGENGQPYGYEYQIWLEDNMESMLTGIVDTTEWTLTLPGGAYEWRVRTICADGETGRWTEGNNFYICPIIMVTAEEPYIEDYSDEDRLGCWTNVTETNHNGWEITTNYTIGTCFNSGFYGPTALISPAIQLPESGTATLSFDEVIGYLNDYDQNTLYVVSDDFELNELADLDEVEPLWAPTADEFEAQNVVMSRTFDLSEYMGQTFRLIFLYEGDNAHAWYVNNIEVAAEDAIVYYERTIIDTVCDQYELTNSNGDVLAVYTESGEYENIYEDSVYGMVHAVLNLTINYSTSNIDEQTACDAYTWPLNNMTYTESTDSAFFVFVNEQGCPNITELHLTLYHKEHSYTEVSSCGPYTWELTGATYNKSGMKFNKGTTAEGCQIRDTLVLTVVERWGSYTKVANCGPYTWDKTGTTYNKSGLKFFKDTADDGCPVRDTLELTIVERWGRYTEATSCGPYTWELNNTTYNNGGLKFNKSYANDGCEIRDTLNLIIVEVGGGSNVFVKNCGPYTWDVTGQTYNKSGEKIYTTVDSVDGCFHRDTLTLTIVDRWGSYTELNYCGPYTWEKTGQTYNKSGLKFYKGTAEDGCPVRDTLNLKIENRFHSYTEVANCGPYTWDLTGQTYSKSGMKFRKDTAENGCLIRDTLVLTVVDRWSSYTKVANCGPYTWDKTGQTYNKSGLKFYKSVAEDGCPIRDTLELTVVTKWSSNDTVVSCDAPYTWDKTGQTYKKTGLKFFKGTAADGCPIRDTLYVIIGQSEHSYNEVTSYGPYTWDLTGKTYNKSGLKFNKGTNADGCPVRDTLNLIVLEPNTGAESYEYEIAENESPIEAPETIEAAQLTSLNAVKVYPNPTTGRIQINVTEAEKVEVLDLVGRLVAVYENTNTLDLTNLADGTYTLRITMAEGVALRKVVKR